jgi:hypothetical protein
MFKPSSVEMAQVSKKKLDKAGQTWTKQTKKQDL